MAKTTGALKGFRARSQSFSKAGLAAILSLIFGERELAAMTHRVISPVDRAERFRIAGETRVDVGLMGFLKINRGGLGISPAHAQRAAQRALQPVITASGTPGTERRHNRHNERHSRHSERHGRRREAAQPAQGAAQAAQRGGRTQRAQRAGATGATVNFDSTNEASEQSGPRS